MLPRTFRYCNGHFSAFRIILRQPLFNFLLLILSSALSMMHVACAFSIMHAKAKASLLSKKFKVMENYIYQNIVEHGWRGNASP